MANCTSLECFWLIRLIFKSHSHSVFLCFLPPHWSSYFVAFIISLQGNFWHLVFVCTRLCHVKLFILNSLSDIKKLKKNPPALLFGIPIKITLNNPKAKDRGKKWCRKSCVSVTCRLKNDDIMWHLKLLTKSVAHNANTKLFCTVNTNT